MYIYFITFLLSIGLSVLGNHIVNFKTKKGRVIFSLIAGFPLFAVSAIRYNVGTDAESYISDFYLVNQFDRTYWNGEIGFYWFNKLVGYFTSNGQWILVICAAIFIGFVFQQIFEDSEDKNLSIFLLYGTTYYFMAQNGVGQTTGCAILLFSIRYIERREFKKFAVCVIVASVFHYSCALFIVAYFISLIYKFRKKIWIITAFIFLSSSMLTRLAMVLLLHTPYAKYFGTEYQVGHLGYVSITINILVLLLASLAANNMKIKDKKFEIYYSLQVVNTWLGSIGDIPYVARRLQWIFGLPIIILIPLSLNKIKDQRSKLAIKYSLIVGYFAYSTILIVHGSHGVLPYQMIFSHS